MEQCSIRGKRGVEGSEEHAPRSLWTGEGDKGYGLPDAGDSKDFIASSGDNKPF